MGKKSKTQKKRQKYRPQECSDKMSFQECELAILRQAVDTNEKLTGQKIASSEEIVKMIEIVEEFLKNKQLLCYGGTAINNILPKHAQFYNKEYEVPDYDFYSYDALTHAKELADIYHAAGYEHVDAKSGVHAGTFKVFVNFIPMADITQMHKELFNRLSNESVSVSGLKYVPADFLRMGMYLELSRPAGDISRWEKVLKRLNLLNKYRPMKVEYDCSKVDFLRKMEDTQGSEKIYEVIRDTFIDQGVVFFGGYAASLYSRQMSKKGQRFVEKIPDFDVLSNNPVECATNVIERLNDAGFKNVKTTHHPAIGEIIPEHVEISLKDEILGFIYKPVACHNYNTIQIKNAEINVATIDTIMSFYLAFLFVDTGYYFYDRILCMSRYLFELEQRNRLAQNGLLQRFGPKCIGHQETMENIRANKTAKFLELKQSRDSKDFQTLFLNYSPANINKNKVEKDVSKKEKKSIKKTTKKSKSPKGLKGLLKKFYSSKEK
jgi:hypothetical protein